MSTMDKRLGPVTKIQADDWNFPGRLRPLADKPASLYLCGAWDWLDRIPCAAVVGTRYSSAWGQKISFELAGRLAEAGWGVVSGLALGIDTAAHRGTLAKGGLTGATLPGGFHHLYPPENAELAAEIVNGGGFLMSEYTPPTEPQGEYFKARDRLQSGLALVVIVVETEADGGTMHTARFAAQHGRPLLVFAPPSDQPSRADGNRVLEKWPETRMVSSIDTVIAILADIAPRAGDLKHT